MKLDAATYHNIINLTMNVAVSPAEAETWKKCLLATADEKLRVQSNQLTVDLLRKLQKRGLGVNSVETFARNKEREGQVCEKATEDLQIHFVRLQFISSHFLRKVKVI